MLLLIEPNTSKRDDEAICRAQLFDFPIENVDRVEPGTQNVFLQCEFVSTDIIFRERPRDWGEN